MAKTKRRSTADDTIEAALVCPTCGARNVPEATVVHLNPKGEAWCDQCHHAGDAKDFRPTENHNG
jgi:hypothetical protein